MIDEKKEKDKQSRRERQRRWRERAAGRAAEEDSEGEERPRARGRLGASVTLHLTDREAAALDMIAAQLYRDNPHDPANGVVGSPVVFPGRPAAMRLLIKAYRDRNAVKRPADREACAEFWRVECAFRKATREDTSAEAPRPPWLGRR